MKWFGESWGAPVCEPADCVAVPAGVACSRCGKPLAEGDSGVVLPHVSAEWAMTERPLHLGCMLISLGFPEAMRAAGFPVLKVIHILHNGFALCGKPGLPCDWPEGEVWVRAYDETDHPATCPGCVGALRWLEKVFRTGPR